MKNQIKHNINPWLSLFGTKVKYKNRVLKNSGSRLGVYKGHKEKIITQEVVQTMKDNDKYIKFYYNEEEQVYALQMFVELSLGAQRVLSHLIKNKVRYNESVIYFVINNIAKELDTTRQTVGYSVNELIENNWLARGIQSTQYFININLFCVGNKSEIYKKEYYELFKTKLKGEL